MNPLASTKCAGRLLMALAAMTSILLIASCGSGGSPTRPNQVGFSESNLNGTYVFSSAGSDNAGYPLNLAGTLVANGSGSITGGTIDVVDPALTTIPSPVAQAITGSYNVSTDGRGQATLTSTAYGTFVLDFVLTSTSHGLVTEFDSNGTSSGTIDLQTAVTGLSQLAGPYAFSLAGSDSGGGPFATAGAFNLDSGGSIIGGGGVEDFNDNGVVINESLSGAVTQGSGTGPGAIPLTTSSFPNATFDFYPIDATHWKLIETDYTYGYLAGDVFSATESTVGTMVFTMAGGTSTTSVANGGLMTYNANTVTGSEDVNTDGTVLTQVGFSGTVGAPGAVGGRVVVTLSDFVPAAQWVIYPYNGGLLMLETDSSAVTAGAAFAQSATSFTASGGYGLNLSGVNGNGLVGYIAQFDASSATSSPNLTGVLDDNEDAATAGNLSLSGTYTPDSPATGRGLITAPTTGSLGTSLGALNLEYYVVDSSTVLFIDVDSTSLDAGQLGVGTFEAQSTPGAGAAVHSHMAIVHPAFRPHAALRRK